MYDRRLPSARSPEAGEVGLSYAVFACRVAIGLVFACSAVGKLRGRAGFAGFLDSVRALVPIAAGRGAPALAGSTIAAELAVAVGVLPGATYRAALVLAAVLLAAFGVALALAVRRRVRVPCRCFGATSEPPGAPQLVRNGGLLAVALAGALAPAGAVASAGAATAAFAGIVLAILAVGADDLAVLFPAPAPGPAAAHPGRS
jgi:Methylamine utilisation protein MauE